MKEILTEERRCALALIAQWVGWFGAITLHIWVTIAYGMMPDWTTFPLIFLIGVAVTGTLVRSRMRLTKTIVQTFNAGLRLQAERYQEEERRRREHHFSE